MTRRRKQEEQHCITEGCRLPTSSGSQFCVLHEIVELNRQRFEKQARTKGDFVAQALLFGLGWLGPAITRATQQTPPKAVPVPPPSRPAPTNPFTVLGLEKNCTVDDVRRRQRELAKIFHADCGGGPTAAARLAEINAAAAECLKALR